MSHTPRGNTPTRRPHSRTAGREGGGGARPRRSLAREFAGARARARVYTYTRRSARPPYARTHAELPCVLTVRDVGKVSALLSFSSGVAPRRHATCPPPLLFARSAPRLPPPTPSSDALVVFLFLLRSAKDASPSSQRFLLARLLRHLFRLSFPLPVRSDLDPEERRWMVLVHHSHPMVTDTPESSQPGRRALAAGERERTGEKERERELERQGGKEGWDEEVSNTVTISSLSLLAVQPPRQLIHLCNCIDTLPLHRWRTYSLFLRPSPLLFLLLYPRIRLDETRPTYKRVKMHTHVQISNNLYFQTTAIFNINF